MLKVLHVVPSLGSGGIEKLIKQWLLPCKERGIEFVVSSHQPHGELNDFLLENNVTIVKTSRITSIGKRAFVKQYISLIKELNIDIVDVPASPSSFFVLYAAKKAGCKIRISHAHINKFVDSNGRRISGLRHFACKLLTNLLSTSKVSVSREAGLYCFGRSNFKLIKNGIDVDLFTFDSAKRALFRKRYGISDETFVVGNVGRLSRQKNQLFLIDIFKTIKQKKKDSLLLIVGEGDDKDLLRDYAIKLNLLDSVLFAGFFEDISPFYCMMDVFVFPSLYEGLGIAAVEAQTNGLPTFVSNMVPTDAFIADSIRVLDLSCSPTYWANEILSCDCKRFSNAKQSAINMGYDFKQTTDELINFYLHEYNNYYGKE